MAKKLTLKQQNEILNSGIVLVILGAYVYTGFAVWKAMHGDTDPLSGKLGQTPSTSQAVASLPELKLHENHSRKGAEIQANPGGLGRENPFLKP